MLLQSATTMVPLLPFFRSQGPCPALPGCHLAQPLASVTHGTLLAAVLPEPSVHSCNHITHGEVLTCPHNTTNSCTARRQQLRPCWRHAGEAATRRGRGFGQSRHHGRVLLHRRHKTAPGHSTLHETHSTGTTAHSDVRILTRLNGKESDPSRPSPTRERLQRRHDRRTPLAQTWDTKLLNTPHHSSSSSSQTTGVPKAPASPTTQRSDAATPRAASSLPRPCHTVIELI